MLVLEPNFTSPDDFYEALIELHRGLSVEQSGMLNAKLILLLAIRSATWPCCARPSRKRARASSRPAKTPR